MTFRAIVANSLFACMLAAAGTGLVPSAAFAQHVVTDNEASKLTLDALTATPRPPVFRRVAYRSSRFYDAPSGHSFRHAHAGFGVRPRFSVRTVSYRHSIRASGVVQHYGSSHRHHG